MSANPKGDGARSTSLAVFLSFLWPGLGQWYLGRSRAALLYALPMVLAVAVIVLRLVIGGPESFVADLVTPSLALTAFILLVLLAAWRLVSMADALGVGGRRWRHGPSPAVFGLLTVLVVGVHVWAGSVTWAFYDAGSRIFVGERGPDASPPGDGATPNPSDPSVDFSAPPFTTPPTASSRINVLITGVDSGHDRDHALTDTLMLASIDPTTHKVALLSFPRDISNFPLWTGHTFIGKINSLMTWSRLNPKGFGDTGGGLPALAKEMSYLSGVQIQYFASINLDGFERMINLVGGVDVVNPKPIDDPMYDWFDGTHGFQLAAGPVHLNGRIGLAYVRSRYGAGDNDFTRAARQQQVLAALRKKLTNPSVLVKLPDLLDAAASTIRTNFPTSRIDDMLTIAKDVDDSDIQKFVLGPPYSTHPPTNTTGGIYTLRLDMTQMAALSVQLFGSDSRYSSAASQ